jgi:O-antigen/teichoic acid export membrane protein
MKRIKNAKVGEFGKVLIRFASSQLISNALTLISGFLIIRIVDPETYGLYSGYQIYLGYVILMHGGVLNGLNRELPYLLGKGEDNKGKDLADSANLLTLLISILASLFFFILTIINLVNKQYTVSIILFSYTIISFFYLYNSLFLPFLYKTNKDFNSLSKQRIKTGMANMITVLVVWKFGIYGLCIRGIFMAVYLFYLLNKNKPYKLKLNYNLTNYRHLLKIGFPIFLVGRINPLWQTIMSNYILVVGGPLYFGYYSLALIIQSSISVIPNAFSQIIYPRMSIMYGQGQSVSFILRANVKPLIFQFIFMVFISGVSFLILPYIVKLLLPKYALGIKAAQWALFTSVVLSFAALNNIYNVIGKQQYLISALLIGAIIGSVFVYFSILVYGFKLETFTQGFLIGSFFQVLIGFLFLIKIKDQPNLL